ncbi:hypothetical protein Q4Q35_11875 [Flavivirga aquimarina]|uniref:Uncharacterized protein n=1 Tax=Flavivirga aquimarina TaxID=2027862 RepID=A0ABT8WBL6_9FLAO|nr:hypothetical protein [Flavivirga aquimarina]MDO5970505.1 hypothetical protein [Flavivirga aquimarina]
MKNKGKQLVIFIPYPDKSTRRSGDDCVANSRELFEMVKKSFANKKEVRFGTQLITSASLVYSNNMETITMADDSIVMMHAYGGEVNGNLWDDNRGKLPVKESMELLEKLKGSAKLSEVHFSICYSALKDHIADLWKAKYPKVKVCGMTKGCKGELFIETDNRLEINTQTDKLIKATQTKR